MNLRSFSNMLQKLRSIESKLTRDFENSTGFSLTRYEILIYLSNNGSCTQMEIANYLEIDPAAITRHLKILEEKGYVKRERNPNNAREIIVILTEFAINELANCQYKKDEEDCSVALPLTREEADELIAVLEKIEEKLK